MDIETAPETSAVLPQGIEGRELEKYLYLAPLGIISGHAAKASLASGQARGLAGDNLTFVALQIRLREDNSVTSAVGGIGEIGNWACEEGPKVESHIDTLIARIEMPRPPFAGLSMDRPRIMGIVNVTPDSFSDGGDHADASSAIAHGFSLLEAGADILDVGGESTRPGAAELDPEEEARRVIPVVRAFAEQGAIVSVDTRHAKIMAEAINAGALIVNDIHALEGRGALEVVANSKASVILMHMQGAPEDMQEQPHYRYAPLDVYDYLAERVRICMKAGIPLERIAIDPGIGFGKTIRHNVEILADLSLYHGLGLPILLGVSRKRFIAGLSRGEAPKERMPGSIAVAVNALSKGVQMLRVHDVAETAQAVAVWKAIAGFA